MIHIPFIKRLWPCKITLYHIRVIICTRFTCVNITFCFSSASLTYLYLIPLFLLHRVPMHSLSLLCVTASVMMPYSISVIYLMKAWSKVYLFVERFLNINYYSFTAWAAFKLSTGDIYQPSQQSPNEMQDSPRICLPMLVKGGEGWILGCSNFNLRVFKLNLYGT